MKNKQISTYYLGKQNRRSVSNQYNIDKNIRFLSRSFFDKKKQRYRSRSFQTIQKNEIKKTKCKQRSLSKKSFQKEKLNQTVKKNVNLKLFKKMKIDKQIFLDDRSDFQPKISYFKTPKFGQNFRPNQNLTNNRLSLLFELQTIKKEFNHNLNQISLTCLKKLSPLKQNLHKSLKINHDSLRKELCLIKKSCCQVKSSKDNQSIERMIWQWQKKRKRIQDIEKNLEKAFSLLLL